MATAQRCCWEAARAALVAAGRALAACGRRSYEIYLFHLLVLGSMRTLMPAAMIAGDAKTVLLAAYPVLSVAVGACVASVVVGPDQCGMAPPVGPLPGQRAIGGRARRTIRCELKQEHAQIATVHLSR